MLRHDYSMIRTTGLVLLNGGIEVRRSVYELPRSVGNRLDYNTKTKSCLDEHSHDDALYENL